MKNTSTVINLSITIEIALLPTSETLEHITTEAQLGEEIEEIEARALVKKTHDNTKIEQTK